MENIKTKGFYDNEFNQQDRNLNKPKINLKLLGINEDVDVYYYSMEAELLRLACEAYSKYEEGKSILPLLPKLKAIIDFETYEVNDKPDDEAFVLFRFNVYLKEELYKSKNRTRFLKRLIKKVRVNNILKDVM